MVEKLVRLTQVEIELQARDIPVSLSNPVEEYIERWGMPKIIEDIRKGKEEPSHE